MTLLSCSATSLTKSIRLSRSVKLDALNSTDQYESVPRSSSLRTCSQKSSYCVSSFFWFSASSLSSAVIWALALSICDCSRLFCSSRTFFWARASALLFCSSESCFLSSESLALDAAA